MRLQKNWIIMMLVLVLSIGMANAYTCDTTMTVGTSGADFTSLADALFFVDNGEVTGNVCFNVIDHIVESTTAILHPTGYGGLSDYSSVTIYGTDKATSIIEGNIPDYMLTIYGLNVNFYNLTIRNVNTGTNRGAIYYSGASGTIQDCVVTAGKAVSGMGIRIASPHPINIINTNLSNNYHGVNVGTPFGAVNIHHSIFTNIAYRGIISLPTTNATENYWGSASPNWTTNISGNVLYDPWYIDEAMTTLSTPPCDGSLATLPCQLSGPYTLSTPDLSVNFTSISGTINPGDIQSGSNWIYVNSSSPANVPAKITFNNIGDANYRPFKNGKYCKDCTNIVNDGNTLTFDVTGFSNYTYGNVVYINTGGTYYQSNTTYVINTSSVNTRVTFDGNNANNTIENITITCSDMNPIVVSDDIIVIQNNYRNVEIYGCNLSTPTSNAILLFGGVTYQITNISIHDIETTTSSIPGFYAGLSVFIFGSGNNQGFANIDIYNITANTATDVTLLGYFDPAEAVSNIQFHDSKINALGNINGVKYLWAQGLITAYNINNSAFNNGITPIIECSRWDTANYIRINSNTKYVIKNNLWLKNITDTSINGFNDGCLAIDPTLTALQNVDISCEDNTPIVINTQNNNYWGFLNIGNKGGTPNANPNILSVSNISFHGCTFQYNYPQSISVYNLIPTIVYVEPQNNFNYLTDLNIYDLNVSSVGNAGAVLSTQSWWNNVQPINLNNVQVHNIKTTNVLGLFASGACVNVYRDNWQFYDNIGTNMSAIVAFGEWCGGAQLTNSGVSNSVFNIDTQNWINNNGPDMGIAGNQINYSVYFGLNPITPLAYNNVSIDANCFSYHLLDGCRQNGTFYYEERTAPPGIMPNVTANFSNINGILYATDIQIGSDWISVNSGSPANVPAHIQFNVTNSSYVPYKDGVICGVECSNIVNDGTHLNFDVTGWSNYSYGPGLAVNATTCQDINTSGIYVVNSPINFSTQDFQVNNVTITNNHAAVSPTMNNVSDNDPLTYNVPTTGSYYINFTMNNANSTSAILLSRHRVSPQMSATVYVWNYTSSAWDTPFADNTLGNSIYLSAYAITITNGFAYTLSPDYFSGGLIQVRYDIVAGTGPRWFDSQIYSETVTTGTRARTDCFYITASNVLLDFNNQPIYMDSPFNNGNYNLVTIADGLNNVSLTNLEYHSAATGRQINFLGPITNNSQYTNLHFYGDNIPFNAESAFTVMIGYNGPVKPSSNVLFENLTFQDINDTTIDGAGVELLFANNIENLTARNIVVDNINGGNEMLWFGDLTTPIRNATGVLLENIVFQNMPIHNYPVEHILLGGTQNAIMRNIKINATGVSGMLLNGDHNITITNVTNELSVAPPQNISSYQGLRFGAAFTINNASINNYGWWPCNNTLGPTSPVCYYNTTGQYNISGTYQNAYTPYYTQESLPPGINYTWINSCGNYNVSNTNYIINTSILVNTNNCIHFTNDYVGGKNGLFNIDISCSDMTPINMSGNIQLIAFDDWGSSLEYLDNVSIHNCKILGNTNNYTQQGIFFGGGWGVPYNLNYSNINIYNIQLENMRNLAVFQGTYIAGTPDYINGLNIYNITTITPVSELIEFYYMNGTLSNCNVNDSTYQYTYVSANETDGIAYRGKDTAIGVETLMNGVCTLTNVNATIYPSSSACDSSLSTLPCSINGPFNYVTPNLVANFTTITGTINSGDILSGNNWIYVNSSSPANVPATITLTNTFSNPIIYKDGAVCTNCTILSTNPVSFNVTGFSNYTVLSHYNFTIPSQCLNINNTVQLRALIPTENYTLNNTILNYDSIVTCDSTLSTIPCSLSGPYNYSVGNVNTSFTTITGIINSTETIQSGNTWMYVNSSSIANVPATIKFSNITNSTYVPYKDGIMCGASCSNIVNNGVTLTFDVSGFSNYSYGPICNPHWIPATCTLGTNFTKVYTDTNNCGINTSLPVDNGTVEYCQLPYEYSWTNLSTTDPGNWAGTGAITRMVYDGTNDVVYATFSSSPYWLSVYNHSSNVWTNITRLTASGQGLSYDPELNLLIAGQNGATGPLMIFNVSNNYSMIRNKTIAGPIQATIAHNGIVYMGVSSTTAQFWIYNISNDSMTNMTFGLPVPSSVYSLYYLDGMIYTGISPSNTNLMFGVYNISSNTWKDLSPTSISSSGVTSIAYDNTNDLFYLTAGRIFVYNRSLSGDSAWSIKPNQYTASVTAMNYDNNTNTIYVGGALRTIYAYYNNVQREVYTNYTGLPGGYLALDYNHNTLYTADSPGTLGALTWSLPCVETWVKNSNTCNSTIKSKSITYTDTHQCGTTYTLPADNGTSEYCCIETWQYNNTACSGGTYTRRYSDIYNCGTYANLPADNGTVLSCVVNNVTYVYSKLNGTISNSNNSDPITPYNFAYDTQNNMIYAGGLLPGVFVRYNISNDAAGWYQLSSTILPGSQRTYGLEYDPTYQVVYTGGALTGVTNNFGMWNITSGTWINLSTTDTKSIGGANNNNWASTNAVYVIKRNNNTGLIYTGLANGRFGVYNPTNNTWYAIAIAGSPLGTQNIQSMDIDTTRNLIYLGGSNGGLTVYNISNPNTLGTFTLLPTIATGGITNIAYDKNNNLVYFVTTTSQLGVYNPVTNKTMDITYTATPELAYLLTGGTPQNLIYDANKNLLYTAGRYAEGIYDPVTAVWSKTKVMNNEGIGSVNYYAMTMADTLYLGSLPGSTLTGVMPSFSKLINVSCVENWLPADTSCVGGYYTRGYYDNNSCGTTQFVPTDNGTTQLCNYNYVLDTWHEMGDTARLPEYNWAWSSTLVPLGQYNNETYFSDSLRPTRLAKYNPITDLTSYITMPISLDARNARVESNGLIYTSTLGVAIPTTFGVYNISSNTWTDLSTTDVNDSLGSVISNSIMVNGLLYTFYGSGSLTSTTLVPQKIGVYDATSNTWTDVSTSDQYAPFGYSWSYIGAQNLLTTDGANIYYLMTSTTSNPAYIYIAKYNIANKTNTYSPPILNGVMNSYGGVGGMVLNNDTIYVLQNANPLNKTLTAYNITSNTVTDINPVGLSPVSGGANNYLTLDPVHQQLYIETLAPAQFGVYDIPSNTYYNHSILNNTSVGDELPATNFISYLDTTHDILYVGDTLGFHIYKTPYGNGTCLENWVQDTYDCYNSFNYTITYHDINFCGTTYLLPVNNGTTANCTIYYPNVTNFNGATSYFNNLTNAGLQTFYGLTLENTTTGKIEWNGITNVSAQNFDAYITIANNLVSVNSSNLNPSINSSTNISLYNVNIVSPWVFKDGVHCTSGNGCNILSNNGSTIKFTAPSFSNYTLGNCSEVWVQQPPMTCTGTNANYTIIYADSNTCGTTYNLPANNGTTFTCAVISYSPGTSSGYSSGSSAAVYVNTTANVTIIQVYNSTGAVVASNLYVINTTNSTETDTGTFDPSHPAIYGYDGNYSTYAQPNTTTYATIYTNKTIPPMATRLSQWNIVTYSNDGPGIDVNVTIPTDCWKYPALQLSIEMYNDVGIHYVYPQCYNGTAWNILTIDQSSNHSGVYENSMYWIIANGTNYTATGLGEGIYYYNATGQSENNTDVSAPTQNLTLIQYFHNASYSVSFPYPNNYKLNNHSLAVPFSTIDPYYNYTVYHIQGITNTSYNFNYTITGTLYTYTLPDGQYYYSMTIYDKAGNSQFYDPNITIDATPPVITYQTGTEAANSYIGNNRTNISVNVTVSDTYLNLTTINLYNNVGTLIDSYTGVYNQTQLNKTFTGLTDGVYRFNVTATDEAGNYGYSTTRTVTIITAFRDDLYNVTYNYPNDYLLINSSVTPITFTTTDPYYSYAAYNMSGTIQNTPALTYTWILGEGVYRYNVRIYDLAGNSKLYPTQNITVDGSAPVITYIGATEGDNSYIGNNRLNITVNIQVTDTHPNTTSNQIRLYDNAYNLIQTANGTNLTVFTGLSAGIYYFNASSTDIYNHTGTSATRKVTIVPVFNTSAYTVNFIHTGTVNNATFDAVNFTTTDIYYNQVTYGIQLLPSGYSSSETTTRKYKNYTVPVDGVYHNYLTIYDLAGNSQYYDQNLTVAAGIPTLSYAADTDLSGTIRNSPYVYVHILPNSTNSTNMTTYIYLYNSTMNLIATATNVNVSNFTGLTDGVYYFNALASNNGYNTTAVTRTVTIHQSFSSGLYNVTFPTANNALIGVSTFNATVFSTTDPFYAYAVYTISGNTYPGANFYSASNTTTQKYWSWTAPDSSGYLQYGVTIYDTAGNSLYYGPRYIDIDTTPPNIFYWLGDPDNSYQKLRESPPGYWYPYVWVQVQFYDAHPAGNSFGNELRLYASNGITVIGNKYYFPNGTYWATADFGTIYDPVYGGLANLTTGYYFYTASARDALGNAITLPARKVTIITDFNTGAYTMTDPNPNNAVVRVNYFNTSFSTADPYYNQATYTIQGITNPNYIANSTTNSTTYTWTNLPEGKYYYATNITDLAGNYHYFDPNITIDLSSPTITFTNSSDTYVGSRTYLSIQTQAIDTNLNNTVIRVYNSTGALIGTGTGNDSITTYNTTTLPDGYYNVTATAYDLAGQNTTINTTVELDYTKNNITFTGYEVVTNNTIPYTLTIWQPYQNTTNYTINDATWSFANPNNAFDGNVATNATAFTPSPPPPISPGTLITYLGKIFNNTVYVGKINYTVRGIMDDGGIGPTANIYNITIQSYNGVTWNDINTIVSIAQDPAIDTGIINGSYDLNSTTRGIRINYISSNGQPLSKTAILYELAMDTSVGIAYNATVTNKTIVVNGLNGGTQYTIQQNATGYYPCITPNWTATNNYLFPACKFGNDRITVYATNSYVLTPISGFNTIIKTGTYTEIVTATNTTLTKDLLRGYTYTLNFTHPQYVNGTVRTYTPNITDNTGTLHNPNSTNMVNATNFFDGNTTTYAFGNTTSASQYLGKTFDTATALNKIYVKMSWNMPNGGTTQPVLQSYNGSTWTTIANLSTAGPTGSYDGNITLNITSSGLRIGAVPNNLLLMNYYEMSWNKVLTANTLNQTLNNTLITLRFKRAFTGSIINDSNITIIDTQNNNTYNTTTGILVFNPVSGIRNFTMIATGDTIAQPFTIVTADAEVSTKDILLYPILALNVYDEQRSLRNQTRFNFDSPDLTKLTVYCTSPVTYTISLTIPNSTNSTYYASAPCIFNRIRFDLSWDNIAGQPFSYYRTITFPSTTEIFNLDVYLVDAFTTGTSLTYLKPYDIFGIYTVTANTQIALYEIFPTGNKLVTSDYVDAEGKMSATLMTGGQYIITVSADGVTTRTLGPYYADTAGTKILRLFDVVITGVPEGELGTETVTDTNNNTVEMKFVDTTYQTRAVTMNLYAGTCDTPGIFQTTPIMTSIVNNFTLYNGDGTARMTYNVPNSTSKYYTASNYTAYCAQYIRTDLTGANQSISGTQTYSKFLAMPSTFKDPWTFPWIVMIILIIIALGANARTAAPISLVIAMITSGMYAWNWIGTGSIPGVMPGIALGVVMLLAILFNFKRVS